MPDELLLGNRFNFLRHMIQLEAIGQVMVLVGRGVCIGVGPATRGPALMPYGIIGSQASLIKKTYYAGPLCDGLITAANQGCSVVMGVRVLGPNYATAGLDLNDSRISPVKIGRFDATGPGAWGQIPRIKIDNGDMNGIKTEIFNGNGGTDPYALMFDDLIGETSTIDRIKLAGSVLPIVYTGDPDPGEAKIDTHGFLYFGTWPDDTQEIEIKYAYHSRKIIFQDEDSLPDEFNNIMDLTKLQAVLRDYSIATFTPVYGATHLPARTLVNQEVAWVTMTGGLDGETITYADWQKAFDSIIDNLDETIYPSTIFTTAHGDAPGVFNVVPQMDAFLRKSANGKGATKKKPMQGFISLVDPGETILTDQLMADFAGGYDNLWMTLIANGLDENELNLAAARAGQEAALALAVSPAATSSNALKGIMGLLFQINPVDRETFTYGQIEVLIKHTGVYPYVGISTDPNDSFKRTVDVRTICECIVIVDNVVEKYLNEKRTLTNLAMMRNAIYAILDQMKSQSILDTFDITVTPNLADHNAVDITLKIQPVGHIERVYTWMGVGYYNPSAVAA